MLPLQSAIIHTRGMLLWAAFAVAAAADVMTWEEAHARAKPLVAQMTTQDQASLMRGIGWEAWGTNLKKWWYVGNTPPVARLGVPSLRMQDSAGGFRTYWTPLVGTVTCWPSLLSMAATFDRDIVHKFGVALGTEFKAKGANAILGPSINVHRVARNGRNFEYLSGEDPYLGAQLTAQYVAGVQSQGVLSVMKHFVFNQQETHRTSEASVVDAKTAHELYYPPFEAGVRAGVSGVMCSYNQIGDASGGGGGAAIAAPPTRASTTRRSTRRSAARWASAASSSPTGARRTRRRRCRLASTWRCR